ncbi:hypothetical protein D3C87_1768800 [compost metagenome]
MLMRRSEFAPHFPADPQKQNAASEQQADDLQQLRGCQCKTDTQQRSGNDANQNCLGALFLRQACRSKADDDGIVTSQNQIDHDNLREGGQGLRREKFHHKTTYLDGVPHVLTTFGACSGR